MGKKSEFSGKPLRSKIYARMPFPNNMKKKIKDFYYNRIIWPRFRRYNKKNYNQTDFFSAVNIETTTYCNLRCPWCPNSKYDRGLLKNKKLLPTKIFKKIIDELAEYDYKGIINPFFWGEPLTDKRMPELIKYVRKKLPHAKIQLNSNGTLLTIQIYNKLVEAGIDTLAVSQYTPKMLPNVKEVLEYLKAHPEKKDKIMYRIFKEDLATSNRGGEVEVKKIAERPMCRYPGHYNMNIDYKGDVVLCCTDYHGQHVFGNIKKEKLIDIWNKTKYKNIRKDILKGNYKLPICKKCVGLE